MTPNSALASSQMHDIHNIWAVGNDDAAMALAVNTVADMGGGWALVSEGQVVARIDLNIAGLMTDRPVEEAAEVEAMFEAADEMQWIGAPGLPGTHAICFSNGVTLALAVEGRPMRVILAALWMSLLGETHPILW